MIAQFCIRLLNYVFFSRGFYMTNSCQFKEEYIYKLILNIQTVLIEIEINCLCEYNVYLCDYNPNFQTT